MFDPNNAPVHDIPGPWQHAMGVVVGLYYPADRRNIVELVFDNGNRTSESRGAIYAWDAQTATWDYPREIKARDDLDGIRDLISRGVKAASYDRTHPLGVESISTHGSEPDALWVHLNDGRTVRVEFVIEEGN